MGKSLDNFKADLSHTGGEFQLLTRLPAARARVRFVGRFEDKEVVWDAELTTLTAYGYSAESATDKLAESGLRPFINIGEKNDDFQSVIVGLPLSEITLPEIRKTMVMMRNYKRLKRGFHEYGEVYETSEQESV